MLEKFDKNAPEFVVQHFTSRTVCIYLRQSGYEMNLRYQTFMIGMRDLS